MAKRRQRRIERDPDSDATNLGGATVLGEPLHVLFSALSRLRFGEPRNGMMEMSGRLPDDEADAVRIFHIATAADWAEAQRTRAYATSTRGVPWVEELPAPDASETFPHIYGPLNPSAVVSVRELET